MQTDLRQSRVEPAGRGHERAEAAYVAQSILVFARLSEGWCCAARHGYSPIRLSVG